MADIVISPKASRKPLLDKIGKLIRKTFGIRQPKEASLASGDSPEKKDIGMVTCETEMERRIKLLIVTLSGKGQTISPEETSAALIERVETVYPTLDHDKQAAVRFTFFEILKRVDLNAREWVQCICFLSKKNKVLSLEEMEVLISELKSMKKRKGLRKNIKDFVRGVKKAREANRKKREKEKSKKRKP